MAARSSRSDWTASKQALGVFVGILISAILVVGIVWPVTVHAQDDVDTARAVAQRWLLADLGKPGLILVEYAYYGTTWSDSSMGCPAPGETPTPGLINGYVWTFTFDNMVRYEVHSNYTGTPAVLCGAVNIRPDIQLSTYSNPVFSLLIPEAWLVFPASTGSSVSFGPTAAAADDCALPGARVDPVGRVASGVTPDTLLDDTLSEMNVQDDPTTRASVGTFGRSTTLQTDCGDSGRLWRVTAFVDYGSAFRVTQWAPANEFAQWDDAFNNMLNQFKPAGSTTTAADSTGDTSAATPDATLTAPLAPLPMGHLFVGDVFVGALNDLPGRSVTITPDFVRRYLAFSPDGLRLSYIDATNAELRVLDAAEGLSPHRVAQPVDPRFPPAWNADSTRVAFVTATDEQTEDGTPLLAVAAVPPDGMPNGADPERLTVFPFPADCPITLSDPADSAYFREAGPNGQDHVLAWMLDGRLLVSTRCDGGLGMLDPADGAITVLGDDLRGGVLSPDRTRFAARTDAGLAILDFVNWQRSNLPLGTDAQQLAWSADSQTLYYSTQTLAGQTTLDDPAAQERGTAVFGTWPVTVSTYELTLVQVDLSAISEVVIWQSEGRGIGRIAPAPDSSGIAFSLVTSSQMLADAFQANGDALALEAAAPQAVLYWLPTGSAGARVLAYTGQPAFAPITLAGTP